MSYFVKNEHGTCLHDSGVALDCVRGACKRPRVGPATRDQSLTSLAVGLPLDMEGEVLRVIVVDDLIM